MFKLIFNGIFQDGNGYIDENELDALLKDLCEKNKKVILEGFFPLEIRFNLDFKDTLIHPNKINIELLSHNSWSQSTTKNCGGNNSSVNPEHGELWLHSYTVKSLLASETPPSSKLTYGYHMDNIKIYKIYKNISVCCCWTGWEYLGFFVISCQWK